MLLRDSLYTTAWFGLMTMVWFGSAQEAPSARLRVPLIVDSGIGLAVAVGFGVLTALHWGDPTALEGRYALFGSVVAAEFVFAGAGALAFGLAGHGRWMAWWVASVVAVHFLSLAWIFQTVSCGARRGPGGRTGCRGAAGQGRQLPNQSVGGARHGINDPAVCTSEWHRGTAAIVQHLVGGRSGPHRPRVPSDRRDVWRFGLRRRSSPQDV